MKNRTPDRCNDSEHVVGESCLNKSSVCCSKNCSCCNGVGLRFISSITGGAIYGSKSYIDLGIEQGLATHVEVSRNGYWVPISLDEWTKNGSHYKYWCVLEEEND